ncbi:MAG: glycosyltransferase family 2 protein [Candidatus Hodarchaeota archaeon]
MKLSVIIPTRNRARILKKTLGRFVEEGGFSEIIIIDGASEDETPEIVESFMKSCKNIKIKYHRSNKREGSPKASNIGMELADGDVLTWFGDDMIVKNGKLFDVIINDFNKYPKVGVIGGKRMEVLKPSVDPPFYIRYGDMITKLTGYVFLDIFSGIRIAEFVSAPIFVRREIGEVVRYDENYGGTAHREESDFTQQVKQKGWMCLFEPKFVAYHFGQEKGGNRGQEFRRRMYWKARNHTYFLLKNFSNNKIILFWYILCGLFILILYAPQFLNNILNGFNDGMHLFLSVKNLFKVAHFDRS